MRQGPTSAAQPRLVRDYATALLLPLLAVLTILVVRHAGVATGVPSPVAKVATLARGA